MGTDEGQALQPILGGLTTISDEIKGKADTLNASLNLDSKSSMLSVALDEMNEYLDPNNEGSIQHTLNEAVEAVAEEDGALANVVKGIVEGVLDTEIKPLVQICKDLDSYIKVKDGIEQGEANTTKKGASHEENVHSIAKKWVESLGGTALHTGGDNKPGDHVLTVPMPAGGDMNLVVESKNESTARGVKHLSDKMGKSMQYRKCSTGLWISKTEAGLSQTEIGTWGLGKNEFGDWLATTVDNVTTALTYLRAMEIIRRAKVADVEVNLDLQGLMTKCDEIRNSVKKVQDINTRAGQIQNTAGEITTIATNLRNEIRNDAADIESLIKAAIDAKKAQVESDGDSEEE